MAATAAPIGSEADRRPERVGQCRFASAAARLICEAPIVVANIVGLQRVVAENREDLRELGVTGHSASPLHPGLEDVAKTPLLEV